MKCVIPGTNIKILARAIHALAKIGDDMYVQPQENAISFRSVNLANSAYADFTFYESFFSYYSYGDLAADDALKCKIAVRSAMMVFKTPNVMDKQVETCHIKLSPNASKLIFILKYRNSIVKTHLLPILDCEALKATYDKDEVPNKLSVQPKVLSDIVQNFQQNLIEVTMEVTAQKIFIRNYIDENSSISNATRTQLVLAIGEFDQFAIGTDGIITFCLKELRAILQFAESASLPVHIHFENAGRPVVFILKNQSYEANLVLSTLNPDTDSQSETSVAQEKFTRNKSMNKRQAKRSAYNRPATKRPKKDTSRSDKVINSRNFSEPCTPKCNTQTNTTADDVGHLEINSSASLHNINKDTIPRPCESFVQSTLSSNLQRKSDTGEHFEDTQHDDDDIVQSSPPRQTPKRTHIIFRKCFQTTFDPATLPGHDEVLAEDSDEEK